MSEGSLRITAIDRIPIEFLGSMDEIYSSLDKKRIRLEVEKETEKERTTENLKTETENRLFEAAKQAKLFPLVNQKNFIEKKKKITFIRPKIPKNLNFLQFKKLNELWLSYASESTISNGSLDLSLLSKIDFHGSILCKGSETGIVLQETKNTFVVVTTKNKTKTWIKVSNKFKLEIKGKDYFLFGSQLQNRAFERATKKIKHTPIL